MAETNKNPDTTVNTSDAHVDDNDNEDIILKVGNTKFILDRETVEKMESPFLTTLVDPDSKFQKPLNGVYQISNDMDPECFSVFVSLARHGSIPLKFLLKKEKKQFLLAQADFFGLQEKVHKALIDAKASVTPGITTHDIKQYAKAAIDLEKSKEHHNYRYDDGNGRIYCVTCGHRDIDSRWYKQRTTCGLDKDEMFVAKCLPRAEKYTNCIKCRKDIFIDFYSSEGLQWCHKCRCCRNCQASECPDDNKYTDTYTSTRHETTADKMRSKKKKMDELTRKLQDFSI